MQYGLCSLAWTSPFSNKSLELLEKAKKMGFDLFEICVEDVDAIDTKEINKAAKDAGIRVEFGGAFGPSRDNSADEKDNRDGGLDYLKKLIDFAYECGGTYIMGPMYSAVGKAEQVSEEKKKQRYEWASENIRIAAQYAKSMGDLKLGIEPLNRYETDFINTVDQGLKLIDMIDMDNVGFLLDTYHMNIEEKDISGAIRSAKGKIYDFHACANDRGTPGKDNFDWQAIKEALEYADYDRQLVIESFTPDCKEIAKAASVWRPFADSPEALAQDGVRFLKSVFG